jgi:5-methylcytosine-specific restriction endonuclease McrA
MNVNTKEEFNHMNKSQKKPLGRYIPQKTRLFIYERDGKMCSICGEETRFFGKTYDTPFDRGPKAGSVDHIVPYSKGGTHDIDNLRWACKSCNCSRGNRV